MRGTRILQTNYSEGRVARKITVISKTAHYVLTTYSVNIAS